MDVLETLNKLPESCAVPMLEDPTKTILLRRGMAGYYPFKTYRTAEEARRFCVYYNEMEGATLPQVEAMMGGSMFGWHVPAADPDNCDGKLAASVLEAPLMVPRGWDKVEGGARAND